MSIYNLDYYLPILAPSAIIEGINTNEFVVRQPYGGTNLLICDTKDLIVTINGELSATSFGLSNLPNAIISTNSLGTFQKLLIGSNLEFSSNTLNTVASPIFTNITGTLLTATQSNITSLGTLSSLSISGLSNALLYANASNTVSSVLVDYPLSFSLGTLQLNYNSTNLTITSNALNTIQNISTTSTPTFASLTVNNSLILSNQTANALLYSNGSEIVSSVTIDSPLSFSAGVLALQYDTTNLQLTTNQLNTIQDIASTSSPTFASITITNGISVGSNTTIGGSCTITGDLTVNGTTTTVNSSTVSIEDNFMQLANANSRIAWT